MYERVTFSDVKNSIWTGKCLDLRGERPLKKKWVTRPLPQGHKNQAETVTRHIDEDTFFFCNIYKISAFRKASGRHRLSRIIIRLHFPVLFIGPWLPTWPNYNCLQIMVCSCALVSNSDLATNNILLMGSCVQFRDWIRFLFYRSHNTSCLHKNCFNLSWDACKSQEKLKTMLM